MYTRLAAVALVLPLASSRNVLFLFEDDGGFALGSYGDTNGATPRLDKFAAAQGTTFDSAYTSVSSCSPSRASLLTGCARSLLTTLNL